MSSVLLDHLNHEQKKAVTHTDGPLLIVAGAGTGKTTVITTRIAWLIEQGLAKPEHILALTFTDKAAGEMEERVDLLLPYGYIDLQISTFHAFCERLLREYGAQIGLSPEFGVLSELDAWLLVRGQLDRFDLDYYRPLGNPTKYLKALLQHFSRAKDAAITPEMYLSFVESQQADTDAVDEQMSASHVAELAHAYHTYQHILLENDSLDFGDLILYCLRLLRERPTVLKRVQSRFAYVLVDEFQDTNQAQYELVRLMAEPRRNITIVGDDDQAIYKFRGASIENILRFENDYPDCARVVLVNNYRSRQSILDSAYRFIQMNNPRRLEAQSPQSLSKKLVAQCQGEALIEHIHCATCEEEVTKIVEKIFKLKEQDPEATWNDFAVLVRSNVAGTDFAQAFERQHIPFQFLALSGLYNKPIVLDAISLLRVIDQPHDSPSLYRVLTFPLWGLSSITIAELNRLANRKGKSLFEAIALSKSFSAINANESAQLDALTHRLIELGQKAKTQTVTEIFLHAMKASGILEEINRGSEQKKRERFGFLQQLFERMKAFERRADHKSLHEFLVEFAHERDAGEEGSLNVDLDAGPDMVRVMTIHAAKGLEFKYVFVVNLVDRKFPTQRRADAIPLPAGLISRPPQIDDALFHLEEERRLFYVAMTRAKQGLFFTSADDYGGARKRKLSRFLNELGYKISQESATHVFHVWDADQPVPESSDENVNLHAYIPKQFSFTQLAAFQTCPLQYKFAHILHVPVLGRWTFSFGKTMHNTLQRYFTAWMERTGKRQVGLFEEESKQLEQNGAEWSSKNLPVSVEELLELYQACWQDDWYPNDRVREQYRQKGKDQLIRYVESFLEQSPSPLALEQGYTYKIGDVILKGRMDRIDAYEDGVEIIDYKTGTPKIDKTLERSDKEQLWLYQLAAEDVLKLNPKKLTFVYLEDGSRVSFLGDEKDLRQFKTDVVDRAQRIRQSVFDATPGYHCQFCDFANICEYRQL
jgi:DNA helicase-2/ATP-dependent DNA helicase PcrA